jgi:hypothetical protein
MKQWLERAVREAVGEPRALGIAGLPSCRAAYVSGASDSRDAVEYAVRNLSGLMFGEVVFAKAFVLIVDEILRRPALHAEIVRLAETGSEGQEEKILHRAWEALRFRPVFPLVPRYSPRATALSCGVDREVEIRAHSSVLLSPLAAMFDPEVIERPEVFAPERFEAGSPEAAGLLDLQFGSGFHNCLGRSQVAVALAPMLARLFQIPALRSASPGRIRYDGPTIDRYEISVASS